ncbi:MAG TPA: peroxiredoxin [Acidobacteriota bacterium]|nr:peroxiredoxin [Acidobacteriota bacterium]
MSRAILYVVLVSLAACVVTAQQPFRVGDPVPDFRLPYATADTINFDGIGSKDLAETRYMLAFYPADWSPACTKEICGFRDAVKEFAELAVEVLPVSADLVFSHHEWAKQHKLPFKLLSDYTGKFGRRLGVYRPEQGMFRRSVFVVGPDGRFEYIDFDYSITGDADFIALKEALARLKK